MELSLSIAVSADGGTICAMGTGTVLHRWRVVSVLLAITTFLVAACERLVSIEADAGLSNAGTSWRLVQEGSRAARRLSALSAVSAVLAVGALSAFVGLCFCRRLGLNREGRGASVSPAWAVWSWLVPGLNLLLPAFFVADLLVDVEREEGRSVPVLVRLVWAWWFAGLGFVAYQVYWVFERRDPFPGHQMLLDAAQPAGEQLRSSVRMSVGRVWQLAPHVWVLALLAVALLLHLTVVSRLARHNRNA